MGGAAKPERGSGQGKMRLAVEVGSHSRWASSLLRQCGQVRG